MRHRPSDRTQLSPERRRADRARLPDEVVDVLVIGGGVTGAGVALDAASRGLSVALLEARDWAAGTSSRSSKLIHGGLRYLEQLAFPLVREALQERARLVSTIAPHLVTPLPFLLPLTRPAWQRAYFGAGVALYDVLGAALAADRGIPTHRHLSRRATLAAFPALRPDAVVGAIRYWDAQVDDARHTLAVVRTAAGYGARVLSSARVVGLLRGEPAGGAAAPVVGVRVADLTDGSSFSVRARSVVAATGVWSDDVGAMLGSAAPSLRVRASKGVHLVVPRSAIEAGSVPPPGLILRTPTSVLFVLPWHRHWIVGTTDTPWRLDRDHPAASSADIGYLLDQVNKVLVRPLTADSIVGVYAGLRPLLAGEADQTSRLSREHAVVTPVPGLVLVAGGKYTTYRVMAADAVDAAGAGLPGVPASRTAHLPLVGAHRWSAVRDRAPAIAAETGLPEPTVARLLRRHGDRIDDVLALVGDDPALARPLPGAPEHLAAEVVHAVTAEGALHLDDVLTRRTRISIETPHRGTESARRRRADGRRPRLGRRAGGPRGRALRRPRGGRAGVPAHARRPHGRRRPAGRSGRPFRRLSPPATHPPTGSRAPPDPLATRGTAASAEPAGGGSLGPMWPMTNAVRHYPWGSRTVIPELLGEATPAVRPYAELWMGAHPDEPSLLADGRPLDKTIAEDPEGLLGPEVVARFGERLPFLMKVLAADTPLSLQAHPTMEQAAAGYAAEEAAGVPQDDPTRTFKDPWHKPELLLALTPFEALCGFRPVEESLHCLAKLQVPELKPTIAALARGGLRAAIPQLLALTGKRRTALVEAVAQAASRFVAAHDPEFINTYRWAASLAETYPGDPGVVISLLCNHLRLSPGEAVFLPAGNLHAYLCGAGVEVMASSDNVLRGGLTAKHVDLAALIEVLDFTDGRVPVIHPVLGPGGLRYPVPVPDFDLTRVQLDGQRGELTTRGPQVLLCTEGRATLCSADGEELVLDRGQSAFVPAGAAVTACGPAVLYRTTTNLD